MEPRYDEMDGFWEVVDEAGGIVAGPFESEQDAAEKMSVDEKSVANRKTPG
jgi:hypothetical protein